ncbi:MAG: hypothetical protein HY390_06955 [Deltaproteobacteria bacterium]|nr:hypothetical protein [Deltaproteobacteria bacterium]
MSSKSNEDIGFFASDDLWEDRNVIWSEDPRMNSQDPFHIALMKYEEIKEGWLVRDATLVGHFTQTVYCGVLQFAFDEETLSFRPHDDLPAFLISVMSESQDPRVRDLAGMVYVFYGYIPPELLFQNYGVYPSDTVAEAGIKLASSVAKENPIETAEELLERKYQALSFLASHYPMENWWYPRKPFEELEEKTHLQLIGRGRNKRIKALVGLAFLTLVNGKFNVENGQYEGSLHGKEMLEKIMSQDTTTVSISAAWYYLALGFISPVELMRDYAIIVGETPAAQISAEFSQIRKIKLESESQSR